MIGVFDSGEGGALAVRRLRAKAPRLDIMLLADRENAPYGTKSDSEILALAKENIIHLCRSGCERVLIACCTASCVHEGLPRELRDVSLPIIAPASRAAAGLGGEIAVIATEATVRSGAFSRTLRGVCHARAHEIPMQGLVSLVEEGACDRRITDEQLLRLREMISSAELFRYGTLILGCTHFSNLITTLGQLLPKVKIISSLDEGVAELMRLSPSRGTGKTVFTSKTAKGRTKKWQITDAEGSTMQLHRSLR